jgi:hypothetical protein
MRYLVILALAGCFHDAPPPRTPEPQQDPIVASSGGGGSTRVRNRTPLAADPMADTIAQFEQFSDQMCACPEHDATCAQQVTDAMVAWSQELAKNIDKDQKPSADETRRLTDIAKRMGECSMKAMTPAPSGNPCAGP